MKNVILICMMFSVLVSAQETGRSKTGGLSPKQEKKTETEILNRPLSDTRKKTRVLYSIPAGESYIQRTFRK